MPTEVHSCTEQYTPGTNTVHGKYHTGAGGKLRAIAKGLYITARSTIDRGQVAHTENTTPGCEQSRLKSSVARSNTYRGHEAHRATSAQRKERTRTMATASKGASAAELTDPA